MSDHHLLFLPSHKVYLRILLPFAPRVSVYIFSGVVVQPSVHICIRPNRDTEALTVHGGLKTTTYLLKTCWDGGSLDSCVVSRTDETREKRIPIPGRNTYERTPFFSRLRTSKQPSLSDKSDEFNPPPPAFLSTPCS